LSAPIDINARRPHEASFFRHGWVDARDVPSPRPRELSMSWQDTVASATFFPATDATPCIFTAIMRGTAMRVYRIAP